MTFESFDQVRESLRVESFRTTGDVDLGVRGIYGLVGRVNAAPFAGKPPGTVMLRCCDVTYRRKTFQFDYRPLPWAQVWTSAGVTVRPVDLKGRPLYEEGDFSPLPARRLLG